MKKNGNLKINVDVEVEKYINKEMRKYNKE